MQLPGTLLVPARNAVVLVRSKGCWLSVDVHPPNPQVKGQAMPTTLRACLAWFVIDRKYSSKWVCRNVLNPTHSNKQSGQETGRWLRRESAFLILGSFARISWRFTIQLCCKASVTDILSFGFVCSSLLMKFLASYETAFQRDPDKEYFPNRVFS